MKEKSREVEEREERWREKLSSLLCCFFFPSLSSFLAAFQSSEGRPCWVERGSSLSFKSHSLWRLPLRISQRDQRRRGSDGGGETGERRREERQAADVWKKRMGGGEEWEVQRYDSGHEC